ncbi:MAG: hypothetical protein ACOCV2_10950 [Persicimonas sp.]
MSWDVLLINLPPGVESVDGLDNDFEPEPIGRPAEVVERLDELFPSIDSTDPSWVRLKADTFSIEFSVGGGDVVQSIMLHVRGGDAAVGAIEEVSQALDVGALDITTGRLIDFDESPAEGLQQWRAFRDQVLDDGADSG